MTAHATPTTTQAPSQRLAGMLPSGMLDWPGRLTATIFLGGCTLRCPYCHNGSLTSIPAEAVDWPAMLQHLRDKADWLDGVVITGGEPTDDPALFTLLEVIRAEGYEVKLDTNGTNPTALEAVLNAGLVASVALDVKTTPERYDSLTGRRGAGHAMLRSVGILRASGVDHEYRTTAYPGAVGLDDLPRIAERLSGGPAYFIQQFRTDHTLDPRAAGVLPYRAEALHEAARRCSQHVPTLVRGA